MKEKIVSLETAKAYKNAGFNLICPHCYIHTGGDSYEIDLFSFYESI